jgi:predicted metal-dependent hydrolase
MFFRDHSPPHFHAGYADHSAAIAIDTLEVLAGSLPRRTLAMVLEWASFHRDELRADWELCRRQERPTRIAPLE